MGSVESAQISSSKKLTDWPTVALGNQTTINGYQIGRYPDQEGRSNSYAAPHALIEVAFVDQHTKISPYFTIGQFICKQEGDWPKYLVLSQRLIDLLDAFVDRLNAHGVTAPTLAVMSGYRTPAYNDELGNVAHSRHIYGDAADIFVDVDGDGMMDDLNQDGVIDLRDARWLVQFIEHHFSETFQGGLAPYPATQYHGPFVHIDIRGTRARWNH